MSAIQLQYVANARLPSDKAYGIQIAAMVKAFRDAGVPVTLVHPKRAPGGLYSRGRIGFALSGAGFMFTSALSLLSRRLAGERLIIYTVDMDTFSYALLPLIAPTFAEMHSPKKPTFLNRFFFARVTGVIATTRATRDELQKTFRIPSERIMVEPNGVSVAAFSGIGKEEARAKLSLPLRERVAVYVGRLYGWKGLEVLSRAFEKTRGVQGYVIGGEQKEFEALTKSAAPANLHFRGVRPNAEIPLWLAAADALIVLGTAKNADSMRYTSPMKVFEYMAAGRPIVASRTEALREVLGEHDAWWYEPDDASSLARAIVAAAGGTSRSVDLSRHDWRNRASRVIHFIEHAR